MGDLSDWMGALPGLGTAAAAASGAFPAQTRAQNLTTRGLLPGETSALSPQLLAMLQGSFGRANANMARPSAMPPLDELGLYRGQRVGFDEAVKQATSQISGNMAGRGFIRPENTGAIAGSAAQYVMPQFAPLIGENMRQSVMVPEQIEQNRFANMLNAINSGTQALGQKTTGEEFYPSFGTTFGQSLLSGGTTQSPLGGALSQLIQAPGELARFLGGAVTGALPSLSNWFSGSTPDIWSQAVDDPYFDWGNITPDIWSQAVDDPYFVF